MSYSHLKDANSHEDLHHECDDYIELRERDKGTGTAYGYQCMFCGEFRGGEVSKKKVAQAPERYDANLENAYWQKYNEISDFLSSLQESKFEYKLSKPVDHSSNIDELINSYCEKHNIDKSSTFRIFLIRQRDKYIENEFESNWDNENQLHQWFVEHFSEHFEIYREVKGHGFINRQRKSIRIDFVIRAKPKLIEHGFTDQYLGVEVKYFSPKAGKGFHGKSSRGVFQALSYWYSGARWNLPGIGEIELSSVLMFSNLSFQDEADRLFDTLDSHFQKTWKAYLSIANHANVGELIARTERGKLSYWTMEYNGSKYYSMHKNGDYLQGNPNVINKQRIGNTQR